MISQKAKAPSDRAQEEPWGMGGTEGPGRGKLSASTEHSLVDVLLLTPCNWSMMLITIRGSLQNFVACRDR